ncbi:hypothetical protein BSKO_13690 [Bryopsis sp. KO-2023]|nr:hypothetical protein BSKO_13690 [Bryopsis sp. KO-2023]
MRVQRIYAPGPPPPDVELGERRGDDVSFENRANQWIVGALFLFFMMTFFPTTSLVIGVLLLLCVSGCLRVGLRLGQTQVVAGGINDGVQRGGMRGLWSGNGLLRLPPATDLSNLRLTLLNREFNESDYEMLLGLDEQREASNPPLPQALLDTIPCNKYKLPSGDKNLAKEDEASVKRADGSCPETCSVCLESLIDGDDVRTLPCLHKFHDSCIVPWLRQKGMTSSCPICNFQVFTS